MNMQTIEELEEQLSRPTEATVRALGQVDGDFTVLGAGGKMGPTLAMLLKRAAPERTVWAVSRFSDRQVRGRLEGAGVRIVDADLMDRRAYASLPETPNVYYLAGMKFGATGNEPQVWAMNTYVPALTAERFSRARLVALSTGNVYPFVAVDSGGATETTPTEPVGEYAQSCLGRERIFEFFARQNQTPTVLIRLNYANEPRYGVIVDVTRKILDGEPVDVTTGFVNLIWQADANDYIARSIVLAAAPAAILNVTRPETIAIEDLARRIGRRLGKEPKFKGQASSTALLANSRKCVDLFGPPSVSLEDMLSVIVDWVASGKAVLGKPTKFQVRDGKF